MTTYSYVYYRYNIFGSLIFQKLSIPNSIKPIFTTPPLPMAAIPIYLYLMSIWKQWKNKSTKIFVFFLTIILIIKADLIHILFIWYCLNDYVSDVDVFMCAFCYSFIFQIKIFILFMLIIRLSFFTHFWSMD